MAHLCSHFEVNHFPRTPYSPWMNGLVEVQNRNLGTQLRFYTIFLLMFQAQMYAYAHHTTPLSQPKHSPYQIDFHKHPYSINLLTQLITCHFWNLFSNIL